MKEYDVSPNILIVKISLSGRLCIMKKLFFIIILSLFITSTALAEDVYYVNQDCYVSKTLDIFWEAMEAANNRDIKKLERMAAEGKIFLPDIGLEVTVAKRHQVYKRVVYCVATDNSVSFWTYDNIITKWVLK